MGHGPNVFTGRDGIWLESFQLGQECPRRIERNSDAGRLRESMGTLTMMQWSSCVAPVRRITPFVLGGLVVGCVGGALASAGRPRVLVEGLGPIWLCYIVFAGVIGRLRRGPAWIAGAMMIPAHMACLGLLSSGSLEPPGPPRSTSGVGYVLFLLMMTPSALAGHIGSAVRKRSQRQTTVRSRRAKPTVK